MFPWGILRLPHLLLAQCHHVEKSGFSTWTGIVGMQWPAKRYIIAGSGMKSPRKPQIKPDAPRFVLLDPHMNALMIPHKVKMAGMNNSTVTMTSPT